MKLPVRKMFYTFLSFSLFSFTRMKNTLHISLNRKAYLPQITTSLSISLQIIDRVNFLCKLPKIVDVSPNNKNTLDKNKIKILKIL